jgi:hypothetical protein
LSEWQAICCRDLDAADQAGREKTPQVYEAVARATAADDMIAATLGVFSA